MKPKIHAPIYHLLFVVLPCISPNLFAKEKEQPAKLQVISETDGIVPGKIFHLGLHIVHSPGWHTYWKNPGDVGMPPKVEWKSIPDGFSPLPVVWASPEIHKMGIIDVQSFHGEVLHIHPIQAPDNLQLGTKLTLKGQLSWLMCSRKCIPAWQEVEITLPVVKESKPNPKWKKLFARTRDSQPQQLDWKIQAKTEGNHIELTIRPKVPGPLEEGHDLWFFCDENHVTTQELPTITHDKSSTKVRLLKTEWAPAKIPRLTGHLHLKKGWDAQGKIHNLLVNIHLDKDS